MDLAATSVAVEAGRNSTCGSRSCAVRRTADTGVGRVPDMAAAMEDTAADAARLRAMAVRMADTAVAVEAMWAAVAAAIPQEVVVDIRAVAAVGTRAVVGTPAEAIARSS